MKSQHARDTGAPIPSIRLGAFRGGNADERRAIAKDVDETCRALGFLIIRDHGVDQDIIDRAWLAARSFFDLPIEQKLESRSGDPGCPRGYFPAESETLARTLELDTPPDLKESFSSGPLAAPANVATADRDFDFFYGQNIWPSRPAGFRDAWIAYYRAMEGLGAEIMELFATALDLAPDYFVPMHSHHLSALRALNYPPTEELLAGQQPAGEHSDYGSVTILRPDPDVGGLEIRMPAGDWRAAPAIDDGFIVNIGDMLARWTNDRWVSTLHRVVNAEPGSRRQSIAYFQNPNYDAEVRCISTGDTARYAPVAAGQYLLQKFNATL